MKKIIFLFAFMFISLMHAEAKEKSMPIGRWAIDHDGLPAFCYTGTLPYLAHFSNGDSVKIDSDPWFVLGNYQLTLFAHVSGKYELLTGQRAWARMNQGDRINTGQNDAKLEILNAKGISTASYPLVGIHSLAANPSKSNRTFGCGYAKYEYNAGKIHVARTISVRPSKKMDGGVSAFLLTISLTNKSTQMQHIRYHENIRAQYETMMQQATPREWRKVKYTPNIEVKRDRVQARFSATTDDPMLFSSKDDINKYEGYPPLLFVSDPTNMGSPYTQAGNIGYSYLLNLRPGQQATIQMIVGYSFESPHSNIATICQELLENVSFAKEWKAILPDYKEETDKELRRELTWHAYMLEAMATYSDYYKETKIPQGTIYDYSWGQHASARDNFQHALATIYYHPELARSIIRYMMKRTLPNGDIMLIEYGNGYAEPTCYQTSDQQLWFFLLLSEYLRITKDYDFLQEKVACYPVKDMPQYTILQHARHCYDYLRNQIGTGRHGLIRLLNSDWCDGIYYCIAAPYNVVQPQGESHMNTAMAISILPTLATQLEKGGADKAFVSSMRQWRQQLFDAYMQDWDTRAYPRRMYFNGKSFGEDNLFLEHLGFTLQATDIDISRRQSLYAEMKKRLYHNEKLGAREQEKPELNSSDLDYGSRENGGFWYSLNGPVIIGVNTFDKTEALRLLKAMSLGHSAQEFPQYWTAYWSAADNIESSLTPYEGLPDQTASYSEIAIACAHVHAWMLYCYNRLKEGR